MLTLDALVEEFERQVGNEARTATTLDFMEAQEVQVPTEQFLYGALFAVRAVLMAAPDVMFAITYQSHEATEVCTGEHRMPVLEAEPLIRACISFAQALIIRERFGEAVQLTTADIPEPEADDGGGN